MFAFFSHASFHTLVSTRFFETKSVSPIFFNIYVTSNSLSDCSKDLNWKISRERP